MHPRAIAWVERYAGRDSPAVASPLASLGSRRRRDVAAARSALGLPPADSLVVISGDGWGVGALADDVEAALLAGAAPVVVLGGRNEAVRRELEIRYGHEGRVRVLGFTTAMPQLLAAATVLVHGPAAPPHWRR